MKSISRREWMFLAFIFTFSFIPTFGGMFRVVELIGGLTITPENPRAIAQPFPIALHVLGSFIFCLFGALQFVPSIRQQHRNLHRKIGKLVAIAGCVSAITGLWMTLVFTFPQELQGPLLYWARIMLSVSMFTLILWAVNRVRSGEILAHRSAMFRAYAIGQGASTQAFIGIGWMLFTGTEATGQLRDILMVSAWGINLLIAEHLLTSMNTLKPKMISDLRQP